MRKLNEFYRALSAFLADPAGHVTDAWATVKGALDPEALNAESLSRTKPLRNAIVVIDTAVTAIVYFLKAESDDPKPKQVDLNASDAG